MKNILMVGCGLAFLVCLVSSANAATLVVADFDKGEKPNNIGGDFGAWNKDIDDDTQGCWDAFESDIKHGREGYAMRLEYDVESPRPAYNGFWMKLQNQDASKYDKLTFWIKGDETVGFSPKIKVELKNSKGEVAKYTVEGITKDWQQITIPLGQKSAAIGSTFKSEGGLAMITPKAAIADLNSLTEFVLVFDDITCAGKKTGTVYLDDVAFVK